MPNSIDNNSRTACEHQPTELSVELGSLIEELASNVHRVWVERRIAEGWSYGAARDDKLKTHPSLVPYDQLSESEKDYDRSTAMATLELIEKLGYRITKH